MKIEDMKTYRTILHEGWQVECRGQPFSIGDVVKWDVFASNKILTDVTQTIEYIYDAHYETDDGLFTLQGTAHQINAIYTEYKLSADNPQLLIPVSSLFKNIVKTDGDEEEVNGTTFSSYTVALRDISIKEVANRQHAT